MNEDEFSKIVSIEIVDDPLADDRHQHRMQMIRELGAAQRRMDNVLLFGLATVIVLSVVFATFAFIGLVGHIGG